MKKRFVRPSVTLDGRLVYRVSKPVPMAHLVNWILGKTLRAAIAGNCGIVSATDAKRFVGFQLMYASARVTHDVAMVVFDLGMNNAQRDWCDRQENLLVKDIDFELPFMSDEPYWQTWNKPYYIANAGFERVMWIDSDCVINKTLRPLFDSLDTAPLFTPDITPSCDPFLYDLLQCRANGDNMPYVNAGVVGFNLSRKLDKAILAAWKYAVLQAKLKADIRTAMRWHDQAALKWAIQANSATQHIRHDVNINFLFSSHRPSSVMEFLQTTVALPGTINHFVAGNEKPWDRWGSMIDFDFSSVPLHFSDPAAVLPWSFVKEPRTELPDVATSANSDNFPNMQILASSLLMKHKTNLIVKDEGLIPDQMKWCEQQNIEVVKTIPDNATWLDPHLVVSGDIRNLSHADEDIRTCPSIAEATTASEPLVRFPPLKPNRPIKIIPCSIADKMAVFVLHVDQVLLNSVRPRPFLHKVNLDQLDLGEFNANCLCENRAYLSDIHNTKHEYIGFASARWNTKYPHILPLEDLHLLEPHLEPNKMFIAEKTASHWLLFSEACHAGIGEVVSDLADYMDISLVNRSSLWANNYICHRDVFNDFIQFWRKAFFYLYDKYGLDPPIGIGTKTSASLKVAYLLERITTAYFAQREGLELVQLVGNRAFYYEDPKSARTSKQATGS